MAEVLEYKIVVLGSANVGKSALTVRMASGNFVDDYDPTIEDTYRKLISVDNTPVTVDLLDTAGVDEFSAMREQWMRDGKGFLLVYSITSKTSFEEMQTLYEKLCRAKDTEKIPMLSGSKKKKSNKVSLCDKRSEIGSQDQSV
ncbi:hypothetical protein RFI_17396 [Reticulomyxa filosa]|uniref:Small monomeric GTPase n=1 Tax=Reticulomyxa filosa TaxID=46433 RepID=X6N1Q7_RETFI|nr:hypothetical protein RFI_17396 [Reticulomyxa filosa]|eukprot:ETO19833.1 hypothetical protein RFI_17396 [Reticulomyxa filosa]